MRFNQIGILVLILASAAYAQEKVAIEYKWKKGDICQYRVQSTQRQKTLSDGEYSDFEEKDKGILSFVVTDIAPDGNVTLVSLDARNATIEGETKDGKDTKPDKVQNKRVKGDIRFGHFDRTGHSSDRPIDVSGIHSATDRFMAGFLIIKFRRLTVLGVPLPAGDVSVGDTWKDDVDLHAFEYHMPGGQVTSELVGFKTMNGGRNAVIKSDWRIEPLGHPFVMTGTTEMIFDLEQGVPLQITSEFNQKGSEGFGPEEGFELEGRQTITLEFHNVLSPEDVAKYAPLADVLTEAVSTLAHGGDQTTIAKTFKDLNVDDLPMVWRNTWLLTTARSFK